MINQRLEPPPPPDESADPSTGGGSWSPFNPDGDRPQWVRWIGCHLVNRHRFVHSRLGKALQHPFSSRTDRWCNTIGCSRYHRRECMDCNLREQRLHGPTIYNTGGPPHPLESEMEWNKVVTDGQI